MTIQYNKARHSFDKSKQIISELADVLNYEINEYEIEEDKLKFSQMVFKQKGQKQKVIVDEFYPFDTEFAYKFYLKF